MAEQDQSSKTEQPTARRLQQGREKGQVAVSQDLKTWAILAGSAVAVAFLIPAAAKDLAMWLSTFLDQAGILRIEADAVAEASLDLLLTAGWAIAPTIGLLVALAAGIGLAQAGLVWAPDKIAPEPSRLSPLKGLQRIVSLNGLMEFIKGLLKIAIVAGVFVGVAVPVFGQLEATITLPALGILDRLHRLILALAAGTVAVMTVVALADYGFQRFTFLKQMRMTRQEVRDEYKETEGDPQIKARIRRLRADRARQRMMAAVPKANVVITNPTHYAVALLYDMETMPAPKLVAKGVDLVAARIRELAASHEVPIVENPPLARALYGAVDIGDDIPPEHYEAVARVIGYVMGLGTRHRRENETSATGTIRQ